ncbi:hypothetical protein [Jiulongibacter sp. NS-SX5]|uniref:hypothetical protein n=1 Tax=Jiulongibacter sp. NS-SX5 TaxID=3463854 RepID=UPI00405894BF
MDLITLTPLVVSFLALLVALWQGFISKSQLEEAKRTKTDTEKLLDEIKAKVIQIHSNSDETRRDVKDQIGKLIDKQDENFKVLLNAPKENSQNEIIKSLLPKMLENPANLERIMNAAFNSTK